MSTRKSGMGSHHSARSEKDEWLSPPEILRGLGHFDLDPCAPILRPWPTAARHFTIEDDGLSQTWVGRVWLNPPYGLNTGDWMGRLAEHGNGIALIFARTETEVWHRYVWGVATKVLFFKGRLFFHHVCGKQAEHNAGAPSALIAYGSSNGLQLEICGIQGRIIAP